SSSSDFRRASSCLWTLRWRTRSMPQWTAAMCMPRAGLRGISSRSTAPQTMSSPWYRAKDDLERARQDLETALRLNPQLASAKDALDEVYDLTTKRAPPPALDGARLPWPLGAARAFLNFLISALAALWLGGPAWAWLAFVALIIGLMILDL